MTELTQKALEQRQQAAVKHGVFAFRDRGERALDTTNRTRLAELREMVQERPGVLTIMQEKAADMVLIFEIVQSHVAAEIKSGKPLDTIPILAKLPAFANSMQRALTTLISFMPKDQGVMDITTMLRGDTDDKAD